MSKPFLIMFSLIFINTFSFAAELTKETVVNRIEVLENGTIQVRQATRIIEDGQVISQKYHRYVVTPGEDVSDKDQKVRDLANSIWTEDVINNYKNPKEPAAKEGLSKEQVVDMIYILEDGTVMPRQTTRVYEGNKVIGESKAFARIKPGDDTSKITGRVKTICDTFQTQTVIDAYKAKHPEVVEEPVTK